MTFGILLTLLIIKKVIKKLTLRRGEKRMLQLYMQFKFLVHHTSRIRSIISAKVAWDTLANPQQQHSPSHEVQLGEAEPSQGSGAVSNEMFNGPLLTLYKYAHSGEWDKTEDYLSRYPDAIKAKIDPRGGTALHVAARAGNLKVVEELVKLMSEKELEIQDDIGNTALCSAAAVGIKKIAECLILLLIFCIASHI
ncbi:hypothetical protein OIU76_012969 [Salix suchowensis]|nr:hypothetical protein OIU76_012969 [Salix suchowensis]